MSNSPGPRAQAAASPARIKAVERHKASGIQATNRNFGWPKILAMFSRRSHPLRSARSKTTREQNTAVNRLRTRPRISVTANPLSWSVPIANSTTPVITVVRFESRIVENARAKPLRIAIRTAAPRSTSSRIRS